MSFLAKLFIQGRAIHVLDTNVHFYQRIHPETFQPTSVPMGGVFTVTLEADSTTDFLRLMLSPDSMCNGYIRFYKRDGMSKLNDYEFFDTYIVGYQRDFDGVHGLQTTDTLTFSPGILRVGSMVFEKHWKVTDLAVKADVTAISEKVEKKPKLVDSYLTDTYNNCIEEAKVGDTIFLNIKTKDMIGELMTVKLNNQTVDFKYNGKVLKDDTLKDFQITGNNQKIELDVIRQAQA